MTLEEVISMMEQAEKNNLITIRLHTGEPSIYGAVQGTVIFSIRRGCV